MPVELNLVKFYHRRQKLEDTAREIVLEILENCPEAFSFEGGLHLQTEACFVLQNYCKARAEQLAFTVGAMLFSSGCWVTHKTTQRKDNCKIIFKVLRMTEKEYREQVLEED